MKKTVTVQYDEESNEYFIPLEDELLSELGWAYGDSLKWIDNQDGSWSIINETLKGDKQNGI